MQAVGKLTTICRLTYKCLFGAGRHKKGKSKMDITTIVTLITEIGVLVGVIVPVIVSMTKIANGTKCQLRSEMLRIYYHHRESETIRQYEYENFVMLYEAYKALKGNSFIDRIYEELRTWKIES
jgi:hypothetical protein